MRVVRVIRNISSYSSHLSHSSYLIFSSYLIYSSYLLILIIRVICIIRVTWFTRVTWLIQVTWIIWNTQIIWDTRITRDTRITWGTCIIQATWVTQTTRITCIIWVIRIIRANWIIQNTLKIVENQILNWIEFEIIVNRWVFASYRVTFKLLNAFNSQVNGKRISWESPHSNMNYKLSSLIVLSLNPLQWVSYESSKYMSCESISNRLL